MAEIYIDDALHERLALLLANLLPWVTVDQVKIWLGEVGNIWPVSIKSDVPRAVQ